MKIIKESSVKYIYPFGSPYRSSQPDDIPHEEYEKLSYITDCSEWDEAKANDDEVIVVSFDDIRNYFDHWDQKAELIDLFGHCDDSELYADVYEYLRDTVYQFYHPVEA